MTTTGTTATTDELVSQVVLGEHELTELVREDDALAVYRSRSTVDGGVYTVVRLKAVVATSGATEIASAAARASRQAVSVAGLLPLLAARTDRGHVWTIRRGEPGSSLGEIVGRTHTFRETHDLLKPGGDALARLHDIGHFHGAISPFAFVTHVAPDGERRLLDLAGLSTVAEASGGARGLADVLPSAYRPPELAGAVPSSVGPWSDVHAVARIVVALLAGTALPRENGDGLTLPAPLEKALLAALSSAPARRPGDLSALLSALAAAGNGYAVSEAARAAVTDEPAPVAAAIAPGDGAGAPAPGEPAAERASEAVPILVGPALAPPASAPPGASPSGAAREPANRELPAPAYVAPQKRDALGIVILVSAAFAGLLFLGGAAGAAFMLFRAAPGPSPTPIVTAPIVPAPTAVPPGMPAPTGTETSPGAPPAFPPGGPPDKAPSTVFLPRPPGEVSTSREDETALLPLLSDDPVRGSKLAPTTLVIFADLTCPHSQRMLQSLPALEDALGTSLRIVVKLYPLPDRAGAQDLAEAALTVRKRGGNQAFFTFIGQTAKGSPRTDPGSLEEAAIRAGAPAGAVTEALRTHAERTRVEANVQLGRKLAVLATPVVFLNGRRFDGLVSPTDLEREIKLEAGRARAAASSALLPESVYKTRVFSNITTGEADGNRR